VTDKPLSIEKHRDQLALAQSAADAVAYGEQIVARQRALRMPEIEPDVLGWAVRELMKSKPDGWRGSAMDLIKATRKMLPRKARRHASFPRDPEAMVTRLKEIAPLLGAVGIDVVRSLPRDVCIQWTPIQ